MFKKTLNHNRHSHYYFYFLFSLSIFHNIVFQFVDLFLCIIQSTLDSFQCTYICFSAIAFFNSVWFFFMCSNSLLKFSLCSPILSPSLLSIFMIIFCTPYQVDNLSPLCFVLLLKFCLILVFRTCSSISTFSLLLCVYFNVLGNLII